MSKSDPTERVYLILGASSDIARALARQFAREGGTFFLAGRDPGKLSADAVDLHTRFGVQAQAVAFDAEAPDTHSDFFKNLNLQPTHVFCVFGFLADQAEAQVDFSLARRMLEVNYCGAVSILEIAAAAMEKSGSGVIVGISSVAGDRGRGSNYFYGSAKAGFSAYLSGLRNRLFGSGVHVMTVKPGYVDTAMTAGMDLPRPLVASPERVAQHISRAVRHRRNVIYTPWFWRWIMLIIKMIPEPIFKRLSL